MRAERKRGTNLVRPILSCSVFILFFAIISDDAWFYGVRGALLSRSIDVDGREGLVQRIRDLRTTPRRRGGFRHGRRLKGSKRIVSHHLITTSR